MTACGERCLRSDTNRMRGKIKEDSRKTERRFFPLKEKSIYKFCNIYSSVLFNSIKIILKEGEFTMPVITIIGCRIFEDEVMHLIEKDPELNEVIVLKKEDNAGLLRKLKETQSPHRILSCEKIQKIQENRNTSDPCLSNFTLIVNLLEFALDGFPDRLQEAVYQNIEEAQKYSDSILVLYGLCGNVLGNVEKDFETSSCPVFILADRTGEIVDDCVGAVLGGRGAFLSKLKSEGTGTYFLTPVGAAYWREMLVASRVTPDPDNIEMTKMVFEYSGYRNVAKINTGLCYEKGFDAKVREFAELYGFEIVEMTGSVELVEMCYERAKKEIFPEKRVGE